MGNKNSSRSTAKKNNFQLKNVTPLTKNQQAFFTIFDDYQAISLSGSAGTGKSYIAIYKALEEMEIDDTIKQVKIIRSAVTSRDIGFLPGNSEEKMGQFEGPYVDIVNDLYDRADAYSLLKQKGAITFEPTSFLRGLTFSNCVIVLDEAQNLSWNEIHTVLTRVGENCKIIVCGDLNQDDLTSARYKEISGYAKFLDIAENLKSMKNIYFGTSDIVRSGFVKDYIMYLNSTTESDAKNTLKLLAENN
jgi:phosphate starvation-inducible PhoH-like protein